MSAEMIARLKNSKGKELYEVILESELASEKEYLLLADKVKDAKVSKMFKQIAKEERSHHDKLAKQFLDVLYQMENFMVPKTVEFLAELPRNANGKIDTCSLKQGITA